MKTIFFYAALACSLLGACQNAPSADTQTEEEKAEKKPVEFYEEKKVEHNPVTDQAPRVETNERTGERTRKTRNETTDTEEQPPVVNDEPAAESRKPKAVLSNKGLASQVSVKTNNYKIVAFGGIRDLQVTLHNE